MRVVRLPNSSILKFIGFVVVPFIFLIHMLTLESDRSNLVEERITTQASLPSLISTTRPVLAVRSDP
jgi:hypothetical protein